MSSQTLLITGATGKQGGAVIRALLDSPTNPPFSIIALTRNPSSPAAQKLASNPNVSLLKGDFNDCTSIFSKIQSPLHGAFLVTYPAFGPGVKPDLEEIQGKAFTDAALQHGVKHFVFSSIDRGGPQRSDEDETSIRQFAGKARVEKHLIAKISAQKIEKTQYTILRTTAFYENLTPNFVGRTFASMWRAQGSKPLVLISTRDIGIFAALAFSFPSSYNNVSLPIGSQALTYNQGAKIFKEVVGSEMPTTFIFVVALLKWLIPDLGAMLRWLKENGLFPSRDSEAVAKLLLDARAGVKAQNICGWTVLHRAAEEGFEAVVTFLLDAGASVKAQSNNGDTALHLAVGCGQEAVARLLLERGANVTTQNQNGWMALHRVAVDGYKEVARLLLGEGASVAAQAWDGTTVLHWAAQQGSESAIYS